ncbi:MAG: hydantoinase/oxoprolinase family protein [Acidobacteria bacterium]|nr:hydantoinase/oxoprolinase family protein [Acidobacteriota bacterium]
MRWRAGIDVGGTFTDFLLVDESGESHIHKTLTTPEDPSIGLLNGLRDIAAEKGWTLQQFAGRLELIVHGTTVATNAVLTHQGAPTGLLTTEGFRDALQMRRGVRESQYDNRFTAPQALVPRRLRLTARERLDYNGAERTPLNRDDVIKAASAFRQAGVEAVAICFMHSHANNAHEWKAAEILRKELPGLYLSVSSELFPQIRFYERTSTAVLDAYIGPLVRTYLGSLQAQLHSLGFRGVLLIMQSNGGVASASVAMRAPVTTLLSGPAAGPAIGLTYMAPCGLKHCITVDMGGTSFDAALMVGAQPQLVTNGRIGGYQIALPMLDIRTIGAGGGSVGWVDSAGFLRMGPMSAGALPGPACYGRGGIQPTCTDADLVLGYLNADYFLGGRIKLQTQLAREAIQEHIARKLKLSVEEAAAGMFTVINNNMVDGIREVSIQRGYDPRDFPLVVAGGAGPIHAAVIAKELEIPLVVVPRASSIFCAAGMLFSDLSHDLVRSFSVPFSQLDCEELYRVCQSLQQEAGMILEHERVPPAERCYFFSADVRCVGQHHEVSVPMRLKSCETDLNELSQRFHQLHDHVYGYSVPGASLELVSIRLRAVGTTQKPSLAAPAGHHKDISQALRGRRRAYIPETKCFEQVPVYAGELIGCDARLRGPALIEQVTTTLFVPPGFHMICDALGSFTLSAEGRKVEDLISRFSTRPGSSQETV